MNILFKCFFFVIIFSTNIYGQDYFQKRGEIQKKIEASIKKQPNDEKLLNDLKHFNRATWFFDSRVDQKGEINNYLKNLHGFYAKRFIDKNSSNSSIHSWQKAIPNQSPMIIDSSNFVTPVVFGIGRVSSLWVDPNDEKHLLIGLFGGGIYETSNLGENWIPLTNHIPMHSVEKIVVKEGVIYAASGFDFYGRHFSNVFQNELYGLGVIKSFDGGQTWEYPSDISNAFSCVSFTNPLNNNGLMLGISNERIYRSLDYGATWSEVYEINRGLDNLFNLKNINIHPNNPNLIFVTSSGGEYTAQFGQKGFFRSQDGGDTWSGIDDTIRELAVTQNSPYYQYINEYYIEHCDSFYSEEESKFFFFATLKLKHQNSNGSYTYDKRTVFFSSQNGVDFTLLNQNSGVYSPWKIYCHNGNFYYLSQLLYRLNNSNYSCISSNSESYWGNSIHVDMRDIGFSSESDKIFVGHDGGISYTEDGGQTWTDIFGDLNAHLSFNMGFYSDPNDQVYDLGTQDTGWYRNELEGNSIFSYGYKHEGSVYTSPHNKRAYFQGAACKYRDVGGGIIYLPGQSGKINSESTLMEDPLDASIIYSNHYSGSFWICNDITTGNWINRSPNYPPFTGYGSHQSYGLAISTNGSNNMLLHSNDQLFHPSYSILKNRLWYTNNYGLTWVEVSGDNSVFEEDNIRFTDLEIDDYNPSLMFFTVGGVLAGNKVFRSTNKGDSWENISYNLPNLPVNNIEYDNNRKILFIGTDVGVYYLDESNNQWVEYGLGLPEGIVTSLHIDDFHNQLFVSLFGNGVWFTDLDVCTDVLIMENEIWKNETRDICGDLIVKTGKTLSVNNSEIAVKNIILQKNAVLEWNGSILISNNAEQSYVIQGKESHFILNDIMINDYVVNTFPDATLSLVSNDIVLNNSEINVMGLGYFHCDPNADIILNNANINLYNNYSYGSNNPSPNFSNVYIDRLDGIDMYSNGAINVYNESIYIQDENLIKGNYYFKADNFVKTGKNVSSNIPNLDFTTNEETKVDIVANDYIILEEGTFINNNDFFAHIDIDEGGHSLEPYKIDLLQEKKSIPKGFSSLKEKKIRLYPNPSTGLINYTIKEISPQMKLYIYNDKGVLIRIKSIDSSSGSINIPYVKKGIYYFHFVKKKETYSYKIIKK